ncbi:hypothetical protein [Streptomyces sp. NPDC016626]|uniref:hypothetical protein n=1 Tax=Streptomyces sp. NPDC016626 TaxID=3364968 RepID=UPI0036F6057F
MDTTVPVPTPATITLQPPAFDRFRWEEAVFTSELHFNARIVALVLAHCADAAGHLPPDGPQRAQRIAQRARITPRQARISLHLLEMAGLISRPDIHTWTHQDVVRPVTLTMPRQATHTQPTPPGEAEG